MTALIQRELFQLLIMFGCGIGIMITFEARNYLMKCCGNRRRVQIVIYFAFWIFAAFLFYRFLYRASHGVVTLYGLADMLGGILLWKKGICGILKEN